VILHTNDAVIEYERVWHFGGLHPPEGATHLVAVANSGETDFWWLVADKRDGFAGALRALERYYTDQEPWALPLQCTVFKEVSK
jgi:hypothetical protein